MRDTYTDQNDSDDVGQPTDFQEQGPPVNRKIPRRAGSKYADILLQRIQSTVLTDGYSGLVGLISFAPKQGVTTMAINLAIRAADHFYSPALIIDGNFSSTKISRLYRCRNQGFVECLNGNAELGQCAQKTKIEGLDVLGAGKASIGKQLLFDPELARAFFKTVKHEYRLSVVDLPNVSEPSLNDSILPMLDGVVLIAKYGTRRELLVQMQNRIQNAGGNIIGIVMNGNQDKLPGWVPKILG